MTYMKHTFAKEQQFLIKTNIVVTQVDGEAVLLNSTSGTYFGLNQIGAAILDYIGKNNTVASIEQQLKQQYPEQEQRISSDLHELLHDLMTHQLITAC